MELNQLAFVLDYIDSSIKDTSLLATYEQLIAALAMVASGDETALADVHKARESWIAIQHYLEPVNWSHQQLTLLETYNARAIFGELAIGRMLDAFVLNFMNPKGVLNSAEILLAETIGVRDQVGQLIEGLTPLLNAEPALLSPLEGDLVDSGTSGIRKSNGLLQTIRDKFSLSNHSAGEIVPAQPSVPLATKVAAAAPIILAAAGKAIELYRAYSDLKGASQSSKPASHPIRTSAEAAQTVNNYVRYSYRQTTVIMSDKK
ncbi:MAG: hypothetical protein ACPG8W_08530 [Candidatus Promineifilaceae bacterium]